MCTIHRCKYDCDRSRVTTEHCRQADIEITQRLPLELPLWLLLLHLLILSRGCWR
jgi:hypothetical protein